MSNYVEKQIQKVLDEGQGRTRHVIVQMRYEPEDLDELLNTASQAMRRRSMAISARSVLPAEARYFRKDSSLTAATRKKNLRGAKRSMAAQVGARSFDKVAPSAYKDSARAALQPLLDRSASTARGTSVLWAANRSSWGI